MLRELNGRLKRPTWQTMTALAAALAVVYFTFFWKLAGLTAGLAPSEAAAQKNSSSLNLIFHNPVNAPHKVLQFLLEKIGGHQIFWLRLPSVVLALIILFCFYKLAVSWFGKTIGLFGTLIFAALPLFVVSARQGSAEIMYFGPAVLMWLYVWLLKSTASKGLAWLLLVLSAAVFVYTPGMAWLIVASFIIARQQITSSVNKVSPFISAAGLLVLAAAAGSLAFAATHNHHVAKQLLLIPEPVSPIFTVLKQIGWMAISLAVKTGSHSNLIIGRLPLLDILTLALLVFGVYAMVSVARSKATALVLGVIFAIVAAGLNDDLALLALGLPAIAVFIAAGLRYLYIEWRGIFPRNPVPKTFALVLIAAVTLSQFYFGLRYALIAWPHSEPSRTAYVLK